MLIAKCGGCGCKWRYDTAESVEPILEALRKEVERQDARDEQAERFYGMPIARSSDFTKKVIARIEDGYAR